MTQEQKPREGTGIPGWLERSRVWIRANKRKALVLAGGTAILLMIGGITAQRMAKNAASKQGPVKVQTTVDVMEVARTGLIKRISLTGQTVPEAQVDIAAKYQGRVLEVRAELGQTVAAGQILILQDTGDANIAVRQNDATFRQAAADALASEVTFQANYERNKADYKKAESDLLRYRSLYEAGAVSREALEAKEQSLANSKAALEIMTNQITASAVPATVEAARAAALRAQYSVNAVEKQRDDLILKAPRDGIIGYRQVEAGSMVSAGQKLLSIIDNSNIYIDCQVSEQDLVALVPGMAVDVQIESLGKSFPGKIIYISPANDAQSQAFSLRIALVKPDSSIRAGMFAKSIVQAMLRPNAMVIPKEALMERAGKQYVYIVNGQNQVEERNVQVGLRSDQEAEILNGLAEGERIAVNNLSRLRSGMNIVPNPVAAAKKG